ncbi:RNA 3'-terminal phosphate cyclase [Micromonospora sp. NPDC007208]|uniref:RNA 3'-terminal phosphate cyclase n=1 Tax=Micromonospora sp. NPDC007208 TaxID=3364236 RepID=UPI003674554E
MTVVDCSIGEGGGGALRAALPLAVLAGQPLRLVNIRASRPDRSRGVGWTHKSYIDAVCRWTSSTASHMMGRTELTFRPGGIPEGDVLADLDDPDGTFGTNLVSGRRNYAEASDHFAENIDNVNGRGLMGNAVSVFFVGLLPLLYAAPATASIEVSGGTETLGAPFVDVVRNILYPVANELTGRNAQLSVERRGCIGRGGGFAVARHRTDRSRESAPRPTPGDPMSPGISARFYVFGGHRWRLEIAEKALRLAGQLSSRLSRAVSPEVEMVPYPVNRVQVMFLIGEGLHRRDVSFCFEEAGHGVLDVETVLDRLRPELECSGMTSRFIAEQLLPLMCTRPGTWTVTTERFTPHLRTVVGLAEIITGRKIDVTSSGRSATIVVS